MILLAQTLFAQAHNLAAFDPLIIIWIFFGIFWIFGALQDGKKKKAAKERAAARRQAQAEARAQGRDPAQQPGASAGRTPSNRPPPVPGRPTANTGVPRPQAQPGNLETQMRELFEQLTGMPPQPQPRPQSRPQAQAGSQPQARRGNPARSNPRIRLQPQQPQPQQSQQRLPPSKRVQRPAPAFIDRSPNSVTSPEEAIAPIPEIKEIKEDAFEQIDNYKEIIGMEESALDHTGGAHNTMSTRSMLVDLGKMQLPLIRMKNMSVSTVDSPAKKPKLTNKKVLRQAIKAQVILEPCKAMQQDNSSADTI